MVLQISVRIKMCSLEFSFFSSNYSPNNRATQQTSNQKLWFSFLWENKYKKRKLKFPTQMWSKPSFSLLFPYFVSNQTKAKNSTTIPNNFHDTKTHLRESQTQRSKERSEALGDGYGVSFHDLQSSKKLSWFRFSAAGIRMLRRTLGTRGRWIGVWFWY